MKKKIILLVILGFCFFSKGHAQEQFWTEVEKGKVKEEIKILEEYFSIDNSKKEPLTMILLKKNRFLDNKQLSTVRRNWTVEHSYLQDLKDIIAGKMESPQAQSNMSSAKHQVGSRRVEEVFEDETLLEKLNLHQVSEEK